MITIKIDVTKIDKSKLFRGDRGVYLDLVLFENRGGEDQYGNHYIVKQSASKAEREAGKQLPIIGNAKIIGDKRPTQKPLINQLRKSGQDSTNQAFDPDMPPE